MLPAKKKGRNFHVVFRGHFSEVLCFFFFLFKFLQLFWRNKCLHLLGLRSLTIQSAKLSVCLRVVTIESNTKWSFVILHEAKQKCARAIISSWQPALWLDINLLRGGDFTIFWALGWESAEFSNDQAHAMQSYRHPSNQVAVFYISFSVSKISPPTEVLLSEERH